MTNATDTNTLVAWWCQSCRSAGIVHCSEPERCGEMKRIPRDEAKAKYDALRAQAAAESAR
jgi:hypothetical protein